MTAKEERIAKSKVLGSRIESLLDLIQSKSNDSKLSLVFRHPKREEVKDMADSYNTPLAEEGREMAVEFGKRLAPRFNYNLFHSQFPRCIETAELILQGIKETKPDTQSKISGTNKYLSILCKRC